MRPGGVNDTLADLLGMQREGRRNFAEDCGRIGPVEPTTVQQLARFCADTLHSGVRYVDCGCSITCLAEVSGAGGSYLQEAVDAGADCLCYRRRPPTTSLCWLNRKALAWWFPATGAPSTASPMCWTPHIAARNFPALTVRHAAADRDPIPTYYKKENPCS